MALWIPSHRMPTMLMLPEPEPEVLLTPLMLTYSAQEVLAVAIRHQCIVVTHIS